MTIFNLQSIKKTLVWGTVISVSAYFIQLYAREKLKEVREQQEIQRLAEENIKRRFRQNQVDAGLTVLALLSTNSVQLRASVDMLLKQLADTELDKEEKLIIWMEIRKETCVNFIYAISHISLLTILTNIQMNLIGKILYLDQVDDGGGMCSISAMDERDFLALSGHFLGLNIQQKLKDKVLEYVSNRLSVLSMDCRVSSQELLELLGSFALSSDEIGYLLIPDDHEIPKLLGSLLSSVPVDKTISPNVSKLVSQSRHFILRY